MNHDDYSSYELSKKLKEKGFDYSLSTFYDDDYGDGTPLVGLEDNYNKYNDACTAPTLSLAQKWLREKHKIYIEIFASISEKTWSFNLCHINDMKFGMSILQNNKSLKTYGFGTYEKALSAGITKAIELI